MVDKTAVIIGAGPAGLTAAYELLSRTNIKPVILEKTDAVGGLARTVNYKGNRIDIGGHRFFSKSDRVMEWWLKRMPIEKANGQEQLIAYQRSFRFVASSKAGPDPKYEDRVMLLRKRKSRIYFMRKFFDYPVGLTMHTLSKLGLIRTVKIGISYIKAVLSPIRPEVNLEQFFINRFGKELYETFFKSYTEKVWGTPCREIDAAWGAQRIKGLSITKALLHAAKKICSPSNDVRQKSTETSLIEQFLYPKYGPGQLWELVLEEVKSKGGKVYKDLDVDGLTVVGDRIESVQTTDLKTGEKRSFAADYVFSSMPVRDLVRALRIDTPPQMKEISEGLIYRDFITVGLLVRGLKIADNDNRSSRLISDNWIYIQEPDVQLGRLQIFNNWSPYLVSDPNKVWLGLEYFCNETDDLWNWPDEKMVALAKEELDKIGIIDKQAVLDATVIRMPKTYPAYFGTYNRFEELREYLDQFENLFLVGRNGMHKYNNQDHAMLTAMVSVDNIVNGVKSKDNIWSVNTEAEYHEEKIEES